MMKKNDSKNLWLALESKFPNRSFALGRYTTLSYFDDPATLSFLTSRYKFCSRLLTGAETVLEVGCGDGFGGALVAQKVQRLICTDINEELLAENRGRMEKFCNIEYQYHDFRECPYPEKVDGIFLVDVIEHIFPQEENRFLDNLTKTLKSNGVCLIGTPNITADRYASPYSKEGHVNLKGHNALKDLGNRYFFNTFSFGMNDEVVHTGFPDMAHYIWILCVTPR